MKIDPYIAGLFFGDGTIYKRRDGAYCVWIDQTNKNKIVLECELIPRLTKMGIKLYFYSYYAKADSILKWRVSCIQKTLHDDA